jgi:hypothetical protein
MTNDTKQFIIQTTINVGAFLIALVAMIGVGVYAAYLFRV